MSLFWWLKSIANFKLSLFITVKILPSNCMEFIFVINVKLLGTLVMNFSWLYLVCWFVFYWWSKDCALIFLLILNNTEEKVYNTDWVQFFVFIKVYEPDSADFCFSSTNSLYFNLNKVNIFFHHKIVNSLVSDSALVFFINLFNSTKHFMSTTFYHVLVINSWYWAWETLHFFIMQKFLFWFTVYKLNVLYNIIERTFDIIFCFIEILILIWSVDFNFSNLWKLFPFDIFCHEFFHNLFGFKEVWNGFRC